MREQVCNLFWKEKTCQVYTTTIDVHKNRITQLRAGTLNLQGFGNLQGFLESRNLQGFGNLEGFLLNFSHETFKVLETLKVFY